MRRSQNFSNLQLVFSESNTTIFTVFVGGRLTQCPLSHLASPMLNGGHHLIGHGAEVQGAGIEALKIGFKLVPFPLSVHSPLATAPPP